MSDSLDKILEIVAKMMRKTYDSPYQTIESLKKHITEFSIEMLEPDSAGKDGPSGTMSREETVGLKERPVETESSTEEESTAGISTDSSGLKTTSQKRISPSVVFDPQDKGFRQALILSEILGKPLSLREETPSSSHGPREIHPDSDSRNKGIEG